MVTSRAITSDVFDATEVFDVNEVTPFCSTSKEGNVDLDVVIAAAKLPLEAEESQFVTVAVEATLQRVEVNTSPDGTTAGSGVDSGQLKTVAVDVCHSVAVRTAFTSDDDSWPFFDSMNLENFSTGA
jgi:hypothetical protein